MKKIATILISLIVIAILVVGKIMLDNKEKGAVSTVSSASADIPAECWLVRDTTAEYDLNTIGTIHAYECVDIVSEINRKIVEIYLKDGSNVNKGQLLFKLDDADITAKLDKFNLQEQLAAKTLEREQSRLASGGTSRQHYDEVQNNLESLRAEIKALKVDLSKTEIRAPFSGKVGLRNISLGAYVNPNVILASLQDINRVKIDFSIPEQYTDDVRIGDFITFTTDYSKETFKARVEATEPQVDYKTRSLTIRAVAQNNGQLVPGTSAKVLLNLKELKSSIFIPTSSLLPTQKGYQVYLVKNGKAKLNDIKTGIRNKDAAQILEGLALGDTVILTNLLRLKPDITVKITKLD